VNKQRR